ncbi:MAG TPA: ABC transporter ATP-binding protein [Candidatus Margulisiibacteriota bacterium]|nr:ABC transporter ATP-binding protein [Candidatus Margulisiibacteriota bacterium]
MLIAKNIHKVYDNGKSEVEVLKGIDLTIEKGSFIAIVGPSGAGKSTLLHILGGLDNPTSGEVLFEGELLCSLNDSLISRVRNKKIGFVFQFYHLLPEFTVLENVLLPALVGLRQGLNRLSPEKKAKDLLAKVGLSERIAHFPAQLSGGERQRVAIVRGLINKPSLLLCDEPTGNLDSRSGGEIISLIKRENRENKMSVVLVTHNGELAKGADKIYRLKDGLLING